MRYYAILFGSMLIIVYCLTLSKNKNEQKTGLIPFNANQVYGDSLLEIKGQNFIFQITSNSAPIITINFDGSIVLKNTNIDEASKEFWFHVGANFKGYFCELCKSNK